MDSSNSVPDLRASTRKNGLLALIVGLVAALGITVGIIFSLRNKDSDKSPEPQAKPTEVIEPGSYEKWGQRAQEVLHHQKVLREEPCDRGTARELTVVLGDLWDDLERGKVAKNYLTQCGDKLDASKQDDWGILWAGALSAPLPKDAKPFCEAMLKLDPDRADPFRCEAGRHGRLQDSQLQLSMIAHAAAKPGADLGDYQTLAKIHRDRLWYCDAAFDIREAGRRTYDVFDDADQVRLQLYAEGKCKNREGAGAVELTAGESREISMSGKKLTATIDPQTPFVTIPSSLADELSIDQNNTLAARLWIDGKFLPGSLMRADVAVGKAQAPSVVVFVGDDDDVPIIVGHSFVTAFFDVKKQGDKIALKGIR